MPYNESKAAEIEAYVVDPAVVVPVPVITTEMVIEPNRFVKLVNPGAIDYAIAATDATIGVSGGHGGNIGDFLEVYESGTHKVKAVAAINAGQFVTAGALGQAAVGTQANARGIAKDDAAIGGYVTVAIIK